ncbi:MAG TPA: type II toxin-antitoxin system VapC family toxin [Syntrophales bacterium]|nr:type II toxin-antitoxin system VapC family toxin [Syntrophales bacterium]HOH72406.1 type II toxin-antitoxin system VapC family toxin [Syntrophales bacterium]HPN10171.1 type II toxin-antitoxin system VapC family toxin [Syntrophales bacterium]HQB14994.1 type II toxin-antitoxin system VapC family toxin [Syntrophales bacterium]
MTQSTQGNTNSDKCLTIIGRGCLRFLCLINLGEIIYLTKRRFGDEKKIDILSRIHQIGFNLISISASLVFQAAEFKAQYPLSYADCFALACAVNQSATLVTGDPEFRVVSHLIDINWIG